MDASELRSFGTWTKFYVDAVTLLGAGEKKNKMRVKDLLTVVLKMYGIQIDSISVLSTGNSALDIPVTEESYRSPLLDVIERVAGKSERDFYGCAVSSRQLGGRALPTLVLRIK